MTQKLWRIAIPLFYAVAMSYATWTGFTAPYKNWDMMAYVSSVIAWQTSDPDEIYSRTMDTVRENLSPGRFNSFMNSTITESKAFIERLPFYQVKPLYNACIWLLHQFGVALPVATWVVSATAFGALSLLLWFWRPRYMARGAWLLMLTGLTYLWPRPMVSLACYSTPDALATLLTTAAAYGWLMRRSFRMYCVFSWLAVLARPDALILCGALAGYFAVLAPQGMRMPLLKTGVLIAIYCISYLTVSHYAHNYGIDQWFSFTFIRPPIYPAETAADPVTLERYREVISHLAALFLGLSRTIAMLAFSALACFAYRLRPAPNNRMWLQVMLVAWACLIAHFLMFPLWNESRYYFCYYLLILFAGGEVIAPCLTVLRRMIKEYPEIPSIDDPQMKARQQTDFA